MKEVLFHLAIGAIGTLCFLIAMGVVPGNSNSSLWAIVALCGVLLWSR